MPTKLIPIQIQRLKKRARTIARIQKMGSIAAHDLVAKENGFSSWAELSRKNKPLFTPSQLAQQHTEKQARILTPSMREQRRYLAEQMARSMGDTRILEIAQQMGHPPAIKAKYYWTP